MDNRARWCRWAAVVGLVLLLTSCLTLGIPAPAGDALTSERFWQRADWRDEVIYFAVTDRFANGDPSNDDGAPRDPGDLAAPSNPLGWHGGDFAGIEQKIKEGYFGRLGVTALWISPVVLQVPAIVVDDASSPNDGAFFAGYHGYWAEDFFQVDPHFGDLKDLKKLVNIAHSRGLKVIVDVVVNHAGYDADLVSEHPEWFHDAADCASGDATLDCPLAGLPDFDQDVPEVVAFLDDTLRFLRDEVRPDGFRLDTVKHVDDDFWLQAFAPGGSLDPAEVWSVGEIFSGDVPFLARYLDDIGVPAVFDFPLYFRIKDHLSSPDGNLDDVAVIFEQDGAYDDPTRLVTFVDNHDVRRFVSEATNRGVAESEARERLDAALSLIFASRGTPSVYYGTEIGMAGQGDPYGYPLGESNREDMDFAALDASSLDERLADLARARRGYPALRYGLQEELWRPNGGAPLLSFRRTRAGELPLVLLLNNGDAPLALADLPGGGVPLLGTFDPGWDSEAGPAAGLRCRDVVCNGPLIEVTGRDNDLAIESGKLVGTVPARAALLVAGQPGTGPTLDPELGNVGGLAALAGDGAVQLSWTPAADPEVIGTRVYYRPDGAASETRFNFAPLPPDQTSVVVPGLDNGVPVEFRVVTVDAAGSESVDAPGVSATPTAGATSRVTFRVDARSQGEGPIEIRRFDTGSQLEYPMVPVPGLPGVWETTLELPLFREIAFKYGNDDPAAKNFGYEGDGQPDRRARLDAAELTLEGVYDFITTPAPDAALEGTVTTTGAPLAGALVEATAGADARTAYALSFADGSYRLPVASGTTVALRASRSGYRSEDRAGVVAPATGVDFDLAADVATRYAIDGDLSDWSAPLGRLTNPGYDGGFGPDNLLLELLVDWDATFLYLAWETRAWGNSAIVHLDLGPGGVSSVAGLDAWPRLAEFADPVDAFVAQFEGNQAQLWQIVSASDAEPLPGLRTATASSFPAHTTETAIPWAALGLSGPPAGGIGVHGGIWGGDGYGAGDIVPNPNSDPAGPSNRIAGFDANRAVTFDEAWTVGGP